MRINEIFDTEHKSADYAKIMQVVTPAILPADPDGPMYMNIDVDERFKFEAVEPIPEENDVITLLIQRIVTNPKDPGLIAVKYAPKNLQQINQIPILELCQRELGQHEHYTPRLKEIFRHCGFSQRAINDVRIADRRRQHYNMIAYDAPLIQGEIDQAIEWSRSK